MIDENDRAMTARLAAMFRADPEFAKSYFDRETHGGHTSPTERERRERHTGAVQHVESLLVREEAAAKAPTVAQLSAEARQRTETEIATQMRQPAYLDRGHRNHNDAVDRVAGLYLKLNTG